VAYAEGLLLFLSLGAWVFLCRGRFGWASVLAFGAALTRVTGVLMVCPCLGSVQIEDAGRRRRLMLSLARAGLVASMAMATSSNDPLGQYIQEWIASTPCAPSLCSIYLHGAAAFGRITFPKGFTAAYWLSPYNYPSAVVRRFDYFANKLTQNCRFTLGWLLGFGVGAVVSFPRCKRYCFDVAALAANFREPNVCGFVVLGVEFSLCWRCRCGIFSGRCSLRSNSEGVCTF
jgi:hypothetical protein